MTASTLLVIAAVALLIAPALSLTCTSQKFSQPAAFANCTDLPALKAFLHWTYNPSAKPKPTLSIAYVAPPANPDGWVAWALNPSAPAMIGSQAFIAFKDSDGAVVVKTYNISSYGPVSESKISYDVLNKSAEYSGGVMTIFAELGLPAATEVNQVWQVGSSVVDGVPQKHGFGPDNLRAKGTLQLAAGGSSSAPSSMPSGGATAAPPKEGGNNAGTRSSGSKLYGMLSVLIVCSSILLF